MLKTLLIITLLTGTLVADAQKLEIGLNGGLAFGKQLKDRAYCPPVIKLYGRTNYFTSVKAAVSNKGWQTGIAVDNYRTSFFNEPTRKYGYHDDVIAAGVFINKKMLRTDNAYFYAGVSGGFTFTKYTAILNPVIDYYSSMMISKMNSRGFYGGAQLGYTRKVYGKWSANAEIAGRFTNNLNTFISKKVIIPATIGVRYEF